MSDKVIGSLLVLAFFTQFFSNSETGAQFAQIGGVALVSLAAGISLYSGRVARVPIGGGEVVLFLTGVVSLGVNIVKPVDAYSGPITVAFLVVVVSVIILSRTISLSLLLDFLAKSYILAIGYMILTDGAAFFAGLAGEEVHGVGLLRFRPFDLHPNLSGFIFGGGAIVLWESCRLHKGFKRLVFLLGAILSVAIVLAVSSRAGLVAVVGAVLVSNLVGVRKMTGKGVALLLLGAFFGGVFVLALWDQVLEYFFRILDLESETRGLDSGGTGRFELWQMGLDYVAAGDLFRLLFGSGIRSASPDVIGFSTESSYITISIENGVLVGAIFILVLPAFALWTGLRHGGKSGEFGRAVSSVLIFAVIQSIFNRYLLAVGNPFSLFLIFLYVLIARPGRVG